VCEPTSLIAVAGLVLGVAGGVQQANAQQAQANYSAQVSENNAKSAEVMALDAHRRGAEAEERQRMLTRQRIGAQRVALAANGLDIGTGTAVDLVAETAGFGEMDALTIRTNAAREAWGYKVEAFDHRKRAEITRREGVMAAESGRAMQSASRWQAGSTLFSAGGNLLERAYGFGGRR
jgi:hypothetical protein